MEAEKDSGPRRLTAARGPRPDKKYGTCVPSCPMLKKWEHPFWNKTAWCWHLMKNLRWYDYWIAECLHSEPDAQLIKIRDAGRTLPPNSPGEPGHK